jgi:predicted secreted hydrolase
VHRALDKARRAADPPPLTTAPANQSHESPLTFPRDHGSHPDTAIEWWYYTGHLTDEHRREYGFQLTFFRLRDLDLAHFAWTDVGAKTFRYEEKSHLALPGIAETAQDHLAVVNEDWSAEMQPDGSHQLKARGHEWELDLALKPSKPPVANGPGGISRKGPGENEYSHYVSITRLQARGRFRDRSRGGTLSGTAWFDHEWGPGALPKEAAGWDWFALQLSDDTELMLYRMRDRSGGATPFSAGTFVDETGGLKLIRWQGDVALTELARWKSPKTGASYPSKWRIAVASAGLDVTLEPLVPDQELVTEESTGVIYWEGTCKVSGTRQGRPVGGRAYVEMTGYARRDVPGFGSPKS